MKRLASWLRRIANRDSAPESALRKRMRRVIEESAPILSNPDGRECAIYKDHYPAGGCPSSICQFPLCIGTHDEINAARAEFGKPPLAFVPPVEPELQPGPWIGQGKPGAP